MSSLLDKISSHAFSELEKVDGDINALPVLLKTVVVIYSAQGKIDYGGLEFFFGHDFPDNPPYQIFIDAYREIGANSVADAFEKSLTYFEMSQPELSLDMRCKFIDSLPGNYSHEFSKLSSSICGDLSVWSLLEQYVQRFQVGEA
jgi:hypothetical protein